MGLLTFFVYKTISHYNKLTGKTSKESLQEILEKVMDSEEKTRRDIDALSEKIAIILSKSEKYIQKVGLIRYNPFGDSGGDQSFVVSILDSHDTGIILTSLYNRGTTKWYVKSVKKGKGADIELSKEEELSIKEAHKINHE